MDLSAHDHLQFEENGFVVIDDALPTQTLLSLQQACRSLVINSNSASVRGLVHKLSEIKVLIEQEPIRPLLTKILGDGARLVRSILFNKTAVANWTVTWHQDLFIAVENKVDKAGFRSWSRKAGVYHVEPPVSILSNMLTIRVHLDDTDSTNGSLIVVPGTHNLGRISAQRVNQTICDYSTQVCEVQQAGLMLMRPLLVHKSLKSQTQGNRRVVHLKFANQHLPKPLLWSTSA